MRERTTSSRQMPGMTADGGDAGCCCRGLEARWRDAGHHLAQTHGRIVAGGKAEVEHDGDLHVLSLLKARSGDAPSTCSVDGSPAFGGMSVTRFWRGLEHIFEVLDGLHLAGCVSRRRAGGRFDHGDGGARYDRGALMTAALVKNLGDVLGRWQTGSSAGLGPDHSFLLVGGPVRIDLDALATAVRRLLDPSTINAFFEGVRYLLSR